MLRTKTLILFLLFVLVCSGIAQYSVTSKIRAGFMSIKDIELLQPMAENGLNTAIVAFWSMHSSPKMEERELITTWARSCQNFKLNFLPIFSLWGNGEKTWATPPYNFVFDGTEYKNTPCPLASYRLLVHDRLIALAALSKTVPIAGAVLDTEMYGADVLAYNDLCFCDYCCGQFQKVAADATLLAAKNRCQYLIDAGQMKDYRQFICNKLVGMARQTRTEIDQAAPSFKIGVTKLDQLNYYNESLARGFDTNDNPVIIFSERTYTDGYTDYIKETITKFRKMGIHASFIAGIWQDKFPLENLAEQYYYCAQASDGYWIYTMETLNPDRKDSDGASTKEYWQAIRDAHTELDKLDADPNYITPLKIREFHPPLEKINFSSIKTGPLEYVQHGTLMETDQEPINLQGFNRLVFVASKGELLKFKIKFVKRRLIKVDYAEAVILTDGGQMLAKDQANESKNAELMAVAPYTGSYCIVLNPDRNMLNVTGFTHPYGIDAGTWPAVHLVRPKAPIYLWKPPYADTAKISFFVNGPGEAVTATLETETGQLIGTYDILAKQTIAVPLPQTESGQIIVMQIKPRLGAHFANVIITIDSGLEKYISPFKSGLVRQIIRK